MRRWIAAALVLLASPAAAQTLTTGNFWNFITSSATATGPASQRDFVPLIRGNQTFRTTIANLVSTWDVPTKAALQALTTLNVPAVVRLGYTAAGDAEPLVYLATTSACTLNAGAGDGGSQVPSADGKCWNAILGPILDARDWGVDVTQDITFSIDTVNGTDAGYCLNGVACKTLNYAATQARKFNTFGRNLILRVTGAPIESLSLNGPLVGATNGQNFLGAQNQPQLIIQGDGSGTTVWHGGATVCYVVLAQGYANVGIRDIQLIGDGSACQSAIYAETGSIYIIEDVLCNGANFNCIAEEEQGLVYATPGQPGSNGLKIQGTYGVGGINIDTTSTFASDSVVTISGTPSFAAGAGYLFAAYYGSTIKLRGNPSVTSGSTVTGGVFGASGNSQILVLNAPATMPVGSTNNLISADSHVYGLPFTACVGAAAGCPNAVASTGLGGGTAVVDSASGPRAGIFQITAGAGAPVSGIAQIGVPYFLGSGSTCTAQLANGTGTWDAAATTRIGTGLAAAGIGALFSIAWDNNAVGLVNGSTYFIVYTCNGGQG